LDAISKSIKNKLIRQISLTHLGDKGGLINKFHANSLLDPHNEDDEQPGSNSKRNAIKEEKLKKGKSHSIWKFPERKTPVSNYPPDYHV
jgi:hypothetical protein